MEQIGFPELLIILALLVLNFVPTVIAGFRRTEHFVVILLLNLFLGWTLLGWVASFVLALVLKRSQAVQGDMVTPHSTAE